MHRMMRIKKRSFLLVWVLAAVFPPILSASDLLLRASDLEDAGHAREARALYLDWLEIPVSRGSAQFGRILLHYLRMGGDTEQSLAVLEANLPYVEESEDRADLLLLGAVLADLAGHSEVSASYYRSMGEEGRNSSSWLSAYHALSSTPDVPPPDPLIVPIESNREESLKNAALLYLMYLHRTGAGRPDLLNWLEQAAGHFPFLETYPDWLLLQYQSFTMLGMAERAGQYRRKLLKDFPESPEASVLIGRAELFPLPVFLLDGDVLSGQEGEVLGPAVSTAPRLQAGAFGSEDNAVSLEEELESLGFDAFITREGGVLKVLIRTGEPERDARRLKAAGYDTFIVPSPSRIP